MKKSMVFITTGFLALQLILTGCSGSNDATNKNTGVQVEKDKPASETETLSTILAKGKGTKSMTCEYSVTSKDAVVNGKVWVKDKSVKSESEINGRKVVMLVNGSDNSVVSYVPGENFAMKINNIQSGQNVQTPAEYVEKLMEDKAKVIETVTYQGSKCKVIEMKDDNAKTQTKMWIREDLGLPVKVETIEANGEKIIMEYKNISTEKISEDVFKLPEGIQITDMGNIADKFKDMNKDK